MQQEQSILAKVRRTKTPIVGEVVTTYRRPPMDQCPKISSSREGYEYLEPRWENIEYTESFCVCFLNRGNRIVGHSFISTGGVSGTVADPKIIFQKALAANASGIIVAHNHPSGNGKASQSDIDLTKRLKECGKFLEMQLLDHIILCGEGKYFSFADEGLI
jgi:DNA repair protein RadC